MGGAEKQAERLSEELLKNKEINQINIITRHYSGLKRKENYKGMEITRLSAIGPGKLKPLTFLISCFFYLLINHKKIDIFHAHSLSFGGFSASLFGRIFRKPSISKIAGGGSPLGCEAVNMYDKGGFARWRLNFLKKNIDKVIAISDDIQKDLLKLGFEQKKIVKINNGIKFNESENKNIDIIEMSKNYQVFCYAGRFEKIKGIDILLKSWYKTSRSFRNKSRLIIIGKGSINIDSQIRDSSVINIGYVNNTEEYLIEHNTFILPSRYEGISNALLEAIKNKCLIIASNVGGNKDIIEHKNNGLLFEKENVNDLTNKIELVDEIEEVIKSDMIKKGYTGINKNYNLKSIANSYAALYKELIN
ncbi:glycosyltransferase [Salinicoccus sp. HZC-1]|uniref:glycosyltransferase n=1 Tax=Salinicoccus sp. HZC-1 TaxID=3385497 RepID=UPI00398BAD22